MNMKCTAMAVLLFVPTLAFAESYKCIDRDGKVSFAFTPSPTWVGESTYYSPTQSTNLENLEGASDQVVRRNLRAAEEIKRSRKEAQQRNGRMTIVPDNTSGMGKERMRQQALAKRRADQDARIAAGLEPPRKASYQSELLQLWQ